MSFYLGNSQTTKDKASGNGGYGLGSKSLEVTTADVRVNLYAKVTGISGNVITIGSICDTTGLSSKAPQTFEQGNEVLIHVAAYTGTKATCPKRGMWKTAYIKNRSGSNLTLSKDVSGLVSANYPLDTLMIQVITLPHFDTVTLKEGGSITCRQFSSGAGYGGVVAFKCKSGLVLEGGHIDLGGKGIQSADISTLWGAGFVPFEPAKTMTAAPAPWNNLTATEIDTWVEGTSITNNIHTMAGLENYRTLKHLTLNCPDGAAFIMTKSLRCDNDDDNKYVSRIGYTGGAGVAHVRARSNQTIIGGSSILLVAGEIHGFTDSSGVAQGAPLISKYPSAITANNRGCGRCYIATETTIPTDEGLYALDRISTPNRLQEVFNLKSFGNGSKGAFDNNITQQINNYAAVVEIKNNGNTFVLRDTTTNGHTPFKKNARILIHATQKSYMREAGRCMFAYIGDYNGEKKELTLKDGATFKTFSGGNFNLNNYDVQIITVPQYSSFTLSKEYKLDSKFENGRGGIVVICVNGTCNLSDGKINVEDKGCSTPYGASGLRFIGNAQMAERLPLGEGHGSVLILANELIMNENTRIGATYSGLGQGGVNRDPGQIANRKYEHIDAAFNTSVIYRAVEAGDPRNYPGQKWEGNEKNTSKNFQNQAYVYPWTTGNWSVDRTGTTGGGRYYGNQGKTKESWATGTHTGGYGSNSSDGAPQGAHVLIIADTIKGFNINAISTGGAGGNKGTCCEAIDNSSQNGGAGHGGSGASVEIFDEFWDNGIHARGGNGGFIGGGGGSFNLAHGEEIYASGGGSGGFCFVYCNHRTSQDTTGISFD